MNENPTPDRRILAFAELVKPELTGLSVMTGVLSFFFAGHGVNPYWNATLLACASLLIGGGAAALNQYMERSFDVLMRRTEHRPIPSGRIQPWEALTFGGLASICGVVMLWVVFGILPASLGVLTLVTYLGMYTPLKRKSSWNTLVGAFPGALPTLIGWTAAEGRFSTGGWLIFGILFLWQFPHFFSLAWMYRKDYARAGYKMLPVIDDDAGTRTNVVNIVSVIGLIFVTSSMTLFKISGNVFLLLSLLLGVGFLWVATSVRTAQRAGLQRPSLGRPQHLFFASLAYLPLVLIAGLLDRIP